MSAAIGSGVPRIGVFDSGVGGLSVLQAVRQRLPGAAFAYCLDNLNFPYGTKDEAVVVEVVRQATRRFIAQARIDLLVIACGTASTAVLPALRKDYTLPVIGVVPAIKPAALLTQTRTIALLATPGTVRRAYTDELIQSFASGCNVLRAGSHRLVELAEQKLRGGTVSAADVEPEIRSLFADSPQDTGKRLDVIVLGCTHFPLLVPELSRAAPWPVRWLDSGEAIAARTESLARAGGYSETEMHRASGAPLTAYTTTADSDEGALLPNLGPFGITRLELLHD